MSIDSIFTYFLDKGILGVIIIVLGFVTIWFQRRIDTKDKLWQGIVENRDGAIAALQEKRVAEANTKEQVVQVIQSQTTLMNQMLSSQQATARFIENYLFTKKNETV